MFMCTYVNVCMYVSIYVLVVGVVRRWVWRPNAYLVGGGDGGSGK